MKELLNKIGKELFDEGMKGKTVINVENNNGKTDVHIEGSRVGILITLAGVEQAILNKTNCSEKEFEMFKKMTGQEEVE